MRQRVHVRDVLELVELNLLSLSEVRVCVLGDLTGNSRVSGFNKTPDGTLRVNLSTFHIRLGAHAFRDLHLHVVDLLNVDFYRVLNNFVDDNRVVDVRELHS